MTELLAAALFISDKNRADNFEPVIERPAAGEDQSVSNLKVLADGKEEDITVKVSPMARSKREKQALIEKAKSELDITISGQNKSLDEVHFDLNPQKTYCDGEVTAKWEFDNYEVIDPSGKLRLENISKVTRLKAYCTLECEDVAEIYMFYLNIMPPDALYENGFSYLLGKSLADADKAQGESFSLPKSLGKLELTWKPQDTNRALQLAIFGAVIPVLLVFSKKEEAKRQEKIRVKKMEADYPEIVSMLSLYVSAGIGVKSAFSRIAGSYLKENGEKRPGFEGVLMLKRDMDDGKGEIDAYKDFGKRMGHKDYRKLSILLTQNLRKGTAQLTDLLEKEERAAFEERKLRAKIAGEEASTKLLLPMMGLLVIVMIVLIFPAMQGMSF